MKTIVLGEMDNSMDRTFESANRVYSRSGLCPTIPTCGGGGIQPKVIDKVESAALRGRGEGWKQELEVRGGGCANSLTTVRKDSLVLERHVEETERQSRIKAKMMPNGNIRFFQNDERKSAVSELQLQNPKNESMTLTAAGDAKIYELRDGARKKMQVLNGDKDGCGSTLTAGHKYAGNVTNPKGGHKEMGVLENKERKWRVRKLTPRECFRLMGVKDEDADKMLAANSATQCYKQAGNSIIVPVLEALFLQMNIQGKKSWNEMTDEERRPLWDF